MVRNSWLRIVVFCLVMFGLMLYPHATTSAHSPVAGIVAPITEKAGASAIEVKGMLVDAVGVTIRHYEYGRVTDVHRVPVEWYLRAVKLVGWGDEAVDRLYHFCTDPPGHYNLPECRGLTPPGQ